MELVVSLTVVAACFTVVQLHHGVDHAGGLPTVGARQWAVPRPQLTDRRNRVELIVPELAGLTRSDRGIVNCDKRRRKLFDISCYSNRRYVETRNKNTSAVLSFKEVSTYDYRLFKKQKNRFLSHPWEFRNNVRTPSIARWKACGRLPIRHN